MARTALSHARPWWLREEVLCRSCHVLHARLLELWCDDCGARGCPACIVRVELALLCSGCASADDREQE